MKIYEHLTCNYEHLDHLRFPTSEPHGVPIAVCPRLVAVSLHLCRSQGRLGAHGQLPEGAFPARSDASDGTPVLFSGGQRMIFCKL